MEYVSLERFVAAFVAVVTLIGGLAFLLQRPFAQKYLKGRVGRDNARLQVVEMLYVDPKRKLVLIKRDDKEHLLLLGSTGDHVVETDIVPPHARKEDRV